MKTTSPWRRSHLNWKSVKHSVFSLDGATAKIVKLRDHPLMSYRGISNWPPVWTQTGTDSVITVTGEVGVLLYVHSNSLVSNKCFLFVYHSSGEAYIGTLIFDNLRFCKQITEILQGQLKRSIRDIGDLNLSHTL